MQIPKVLEIKGNSLDDGPGIRSVVFFKGCPLSCVWCHNPESKRTETEISHDRQECIGCGSCIEVCPEKALSPDNRFFVDRDRCTLCFKCTEVCPAKAITRVGKEMQIDEIVSTVSSDKPFFDVSGGGVTLSGGEATMCTEWVGELAKSLREKGIKVLLETCGMFSYELASKCLLPYVTDIYCDIKIFDRQLHKKYCGVYNDVILDNFRRMFADAGKFGYSIMPRVPLVPGITDTDENLSAIAGYMKDVGVERTELLPYNPTWYSKNDKLGIIRDEALEGLDSWQAREKIEHCREIFKNKNIEC